VLLDEEILPRPARLLALSGMDVLHVAGNLEVGIGGSLQGLGSSSDRGPRRSGSRLPLADKSGSGERRPRAVAARSQGAACRSTSVHDQQAPSTVAPACYPQVFC